ncbi:putative addiction module antidote protein [Desulfovibrio sp. OttesenSCG-928-F20]|nr:putative addiction module antidote protein [Desulfovibrio sp. OttesenSCG-928-F20]
MKITKFDVTDHLDNEEVIAQYLAAALEDSNPDVFLAALADVAKARGMAKLAQDAGLSRESLYKTLSPGAKPRFETVMKISKALGVPFGIKETAEAMRT